MKIFYERTRKMWPFNTGDCLIEVTAWAGYYSHNYGSQNITPWKGWKTLITCFLVSLSSNKTNIDVCVNCPKFRQPILFVELGGGGGWVIVVTFTIRLTISRLSASALLDGRPDTFEDLTCENLVHLWVDMRKTLDGYQCRTYVSCFRRKRHKPLDHTGSLSIGWSNEKHKNTTLSKQFQNSTAKLWKEAKSIQVANKNMP